MTQKQFEQKYKRLVHTLRSDLVVMGLKAFNSGAINKTEYQDDYRLPKMILTAALKNVSEYYTPPGKDFKFRKEVNNIRHFI